MFEAKEPSFWKYVDNEGKLKKDAPESAKKAYKKWKSPDPSRRVKTTNTKKTKK